MKLPENGEGYGIVFEHSDVVISYLAQWKEPKLNLTFLARRRWIEKATTKQLCLEFRRGRTSIRDSIRTLRKMGLEELELSPSDRELVQKAIISESNEMLGRGTGEAVV